MRLYHQLYRQPNPPPKSLRGEKKKLHQDLFRMLRNVEQNPSSRARIKSRRGEALTEGIVLPERLTPSEKRVRKYVSAEEKRLRREAKEAEGSAGSSKEERALAAAERKIQKSRAPYQSYHIRGRQKFGRDIHSVMPSEISKKGIEGRRHDTSAAWNFLGRIQARLMEIAKPTSKRCDMMDVPWSYMPWEISGRKGTVCLPVGTRGDDFRLHKVAKEDMEEWDHLIRLRNVIKAALEKRLDGRNLEASLQEAIRELDRKEMAYIQKFMRDAQYGPQEDFSRMSKKRRKQALWNLTRLGEEARASASGDPEIKRAKSKVTALAYKREEERAKEAKQRKARKKAEAFLEEQYEEGRTRKLSREEEIFGVEHVAMIRDFDRVFDKDDLSYVYDFKPKDPKLFALVGQILEEKGVSAKSILKFRLERLDALIEDESDDDRLRNLKRKRKSIEERYKRASTARFGPFPSNKNLDFGAKGNWIPIQDFRRFLIRMDRVPVPVGTAKTKAEKYADFKKKLALYLEGSELKMRGSKLKRESRASRDEKRIELLNSKQAFRKFVDANKKDSIERTWELEKRVDRKPSTKATATEVDRARKNMLRAHRAIVNYRWETAKIIVYEELGGQAMSPSEVARHTRTEHAVRPEGKMFKIRGGFKGYFADESTQAPDSSKPYHWMFIGVEETMKSRKEGIRAAKQNKRHEPKYHEIPMFEGWSGSKTNASQAINKSLEIHTELRKDGENAGYDNLSDPNRRWIRVNKPKISTGTALLLLNASDHLEKRAEAEEEKYRKSSSAKRKTMGTPNWEMLQYLLDAVGEFEKGAEMAKKKVSAKESGHRWMGLDSKDPQRFRDLKRMTAGETRMHAGKNFRIKVKRMMKPNQYKIEVTVQGKKGGRPVTQRRRVESRASDIEARAFSIAGALAAAQDIELGLRSTNPGRSMKRLENSCRKYCEGRMPKKKGRKKNPGIPREAADLSSIGEMSGLFQMPDDPEIAYKQGYYAGIIKGIDTCGVQNYFQRRKVRKQFEKRLIDGMMRFQQSQGVRKGGKRYKVEDDFDEFDEF